jgi:hypothetical protein
MISLVRRWSLPAAIITAGFALTACAGNNGSPVPLGPNQISPTGLFGAQLHGMAQGGVPAAAPKCPSQYLQCFTVSLKKGLVINWCDGTKKEPCIDTSKYTWSGDVCEATSTPTCGPIKQMTAAWTGPFPCKKDPKACGGTKKGDYEVDTISIGSPKPKKTKKYLYKQEIELDGSAAAYIGLNVGP